MHENTEQDMTRRAAIFLALSFAALIWLIHPLLAQKKPGQGEKELTPAREEANAHFLKGEEYFLKKDFEQAEAELKACLETLPGHANTLFFLAQIDYLNGKFEGALAGIQKAKGAHTASAGAHKPLGPQSRKALLEERRMREEEIVFRENTLNNDLCKTDHEKIMLAETIDELRQEISAINARLNEPAQAEPLPLPADYSYIHGNILFKMNKFQEAESEYLKAVGADPHHLPAYNNLINLCYVAKDYERALRYVEEAERNGLALNPKLKEAILQFARK